MSYTARRISEELASNRSKKIAIVASVKNQEEPVLAVEARTSQPGKHGSAKTALRLKHYFTGKTVQVLVTATQKFLSLKEHPLYSTGTAIVLNYNPSTKVTEIINFNQELLRVECDNKPNSNEVEYECWDNTYYKIKQA